MAHERLSTDVTDDAALGGRLRLLQPRRGHRFGHDAVILAAATPARPGDRVVDLGAGVGLAGLALATRVPGCRVTLVEIEPALAALARENAACNGLADRVDVAALDVAADAATFAASGLSPASAGAVLMNPPFNDAASAQASPDKTRARAHVATPRLLAEWVGAAERLLVIDGTLALIWRADGLGDVLNALRESFGCIAVTPIHPRPDAPAIRIVATAVKASRAPLALLPPLVLNDAAGRPSAPAEAILRDLAPLH